MTNNKALLLLSIYSCLLFFTFEIITDFWFGSMLPGYNWVEQSISYMGQSGSLIESWLRMWGIAFSFLLILFSIGFYQVYRDRKGILLATIFIILYALGEGIGSGLFPINPPGTPITMDAFLHNLFGGIGDTALVLLPFVLMVIFSEKENAGFRKYLWSVVILGILTASFFLAAKYFKPDNFMLYYKGVWQRLYLLNYHLMLVVLSFKMYKEIKNKR